jgi:hypothetical protein
MGLTQPLTEMSIRNLRGGGKVQPVRKAYNPTPMSADYVQKWDLNVSQRYRPPRLLTEMGVTSWPPVRPCRKLAYCVVCSLSLLASRNKHVCFPLWKFSCFKMLQHPKLPRSQTGLDCHIKHSLLICPINDLGDRQRSGFLYRRLQINCHQLNFLLPRSNGFK